MAEVRIPFIDFSNEGSNATIPVADAILDADITTLFASIVGVTLGNAQKAVLVTSVDKDAGTAGAPANAFAQREIKWLIHYTDNVNLKKRTRELPTADLSLAVAGTDNMDLSAGAGLTLKNQLEAFMLSTDGNAITVDEIEFVGRST